MSLEVCIQSISIYIYTYIHILLGLIWLLSSNEQKVAQCRVYGHLNMYSEAKLGLLSEAATTRTGRHCMCQPQPALRSDCSSELSYNLNCSAGQGSTSRKCERGPWHRMPCWADLGQRSQVGVIKASKPP